MPNYDLRCMDCNTEHNIRAGMKEKSEKQIACPDCGSHELETVFRTAPAVVKGMISAPCRLFPASRRDILPQLQCQNCHTIHD